MAEPLRKSGLRAVIVLVTLGLLVLVPYLSNAYVLHLFSQLFILAILILGLNVIVGYSGQFAFSHSAFYGIGAYVASVLEVKFGWNYFLALPVALAACALVAVVIGIPSFKLSAYYLAVATLAFGIIFTSLVIGLRQFTGGGTGLTGIPKISLLGNSTLAVGYYVALAAALVSFFIIFNLVHSKTGRALAAIRENEDSAQSLGIDVYRYKIAAFAISAVLAGLAGALYASSIGFINPAAFDVESTMLSFTGLVVGGLGSIPGSVIGAAFMIVVPELLYAFQGWSLLVYGVILYLTIRFLPLGLAGLGSPRFTRPIRSVKLIRAKSSGVPSVRH